MMHTNAKTISEAISAKGEFRAGGTDIQERIRSRISGHDLVDIQAIPDLDKVEFHDQGVTIGASAKIEAVGVHQQLMREYPALTLPAQTLGTPQIRNMATIGGVLCQRTRCWYYRHPELGCPKKGNSEICSARVGNHQLGVCFDFGPCVHPHPSSIGCALLTYDAEIEVAGRERISVAELYGDGSDPTRDHLLEMGEMITHVHLPRAEPGEKASYYRHMSRAWAEWPLVEVVVRLMVEEETIRDVKVGIGGVANIPFRLTEVEDALKGKPSNVETFAAASKLSIARANPLPQTEYKLGMVTASVLQALDEAMNNQSGGKLVL